MRHIGITGTQRGGTGAQLRALRHLLDLLTPFELHHGDCVGVDEEAHDLAREDPANRIVVHPPTDDSKRAFKAADADHSVVPRPYLKRNTDIARAGEDTLIAVPQGPERVRSGTWSTVRRARDLGRRIVIIHPDGALTSEGERRG